MARILIVDDDAGVRATVGLLLRRAGHVTAEAVDGRQCVQSVAAFRPDLVLLDMLMRGADGLETIQALQQSGATAPIIAMSGGGGRLTGGPLLQAAALMGAAATLPKPIRAADLLRTVDEWTAAPAAAAAGA